MKDRIKHRYVTNTEQETHDLGSKIGKCLNKSSIVLLTGEPGAGKTVLTRGIAAGLGIEGYITSPTFTIINEYDGNIPLYHMDAYRIGSAGEMEDAGFLEYITDGGLYGPGVVVIEWPGNIAGLIPEEAMGACVSVNIRKQPEVNDDIRIIEID